MIFFFEKKTHSRTLNNKQIKNIYIYIIRITVNEFFVCVSCIVYIEDDGEEKRFACVNNGAISRRECVTNISNTHSL